MNDKYFAFELLILHTYVNDQNLILIMVLIQLIPNYMCHFDQMILVSQVSKWLVATEMMGFLV